MTEAEIAVLVEKIAGQLFVPIEASGRHVHVTKQQALALELHCDTADMPTLVQNSRFIMLGVKPHQIKAVCEQLTSLAY